MHWKISRDPYYSELYDLLGPQGIEEAGFFFDTATEDFSIAETLSWMCTPLYFEQLKRAQNPAILLCTGAFCPAHEGHIAMMRLAKQRVESEGYEVVGAYLSPGHDEYISSKTGTKAIPIHYRLRHLQQLIDKSGEGAWLCIDPWEGLFNKVAVNFTDVLHRLERYLEKHLGRKIPVFYVCGADNARFALTFLQTGQAVIVGRPTYETRFEQYQQRLANHKNILWIAGDFVQNSTEIRNNSHFEKDKNKCLMLRVEEQDPREKELEQLLAPYFLQIQISKLSEQKQRFQALEKSRLISLDAMLPGIHNLAISRCYDCFGTRFLYYTERPGAAALDKQLVQIPSDKRYWLFDDDVHSGGTMQFAQKSLEKVGIGIEGSFALNERAGEDTETLDCRDFLIGAAQGGLVLRFGAKLLRVPYCYPFVCPFVRASIQDPLRFSKAVWLLNADYFSKNGQRLCDLAENWQRLFLYLGFNAEEQLRDICLWYYQYLEQKL